jgi:hypothetical protein
MLSSISSTACKEAQAMLLNFGQPDNSVIQLAYVVEDIEASILDYHKRMNVGPWQLRGPFTTTSARYRGQPVGLSLSIAHAFAGHTMIELIQQHDDQPSVYTDTIKQRGYGFHHWGVSCRDYDTTLGRMEAEGIKVDFEDMTAIGTRVAYIDFRKEMGGFIEYIEMTPAAEARYTGMFARGLVWDGIELIKRV